jgi:lantibiotic modifying enzyme
VFLGEKAFIFAFQQLTIYKKQTKMSAEPRYYPNHHHLSNYSLDKVDIPLLIHSCNNFIANSILVLEQAVSRSNYSYDMYTGKVGMIFSLHRCEMYHKKDKNIPFPILNQDHPDHKKARRTHGSIGLASDSLVTEMYNCLLSNRPFDIDDTIYQNCPDSEILNGKSGLVLLLDYFHHVKGMKLARPDLTSLVISSISLEDFPWKWNDTIYYGAAHGTAGILFVLSRLGHIVDLEKYRTFIDSSRLESGNFKSSASSKSDKLIHWCHGAPGFIPLLYEYHPKLESATSVDQVNNLNKIQESLELIWEKGLLRKGCNICHGIAGNGYSFVIAYQKTLDIQHLSQAIVFLTEILKFTPLQACENADHPYSLFEGLAGTLHYVLDMIEILQFYSKNEIEAIKTFKLFDGLQIF